MKPTCDKCRFYRATRGTDPETNETEDLSHGMCYRYPPTFNVEFARRRVEFGEDCEPLEDPILWMYPAMAYNDWCGEFQPIAESGTETLEDIPLRQVEMSQRLRRSLRRGWDADLNPLVSFPIGTIDQLAARSADELLEIKGLGETCLNEIRDILLQYKRNLRGE